MREGAQGGVFGEGMFVVDVEMQPGNVVEVTVDGDQGVGIEECVALSRVINEAFDRDVEDYELTVGSAGVGQPLKVLRQYKKLIGRPVEVMLGSGTKIIAELRAVDEAGVELAWMEKELVGKRKQDVERVERYPFAEVKWTKEWLDFK